MRNETVTIRSPGVDWKGLGYLVSILSVLLLGAIAWPTPDKPWWQLPVLIAGMAASIVGMGFRYKAHVDQQRELKEAEARMSPKNGNR